MRLFRILRVDVLGGGNKHNPCSHRKIWSPIQLSWRNVAYFLRMYLKHVGCTAPWVFPSLGVLLEYWIEHVAHGLLYVVFTFPTMIFYGAVSGFATDWHCGVWCRGLTTCLLITGLLYGNLVQNGGRLVGLTKRKTDFLLFLIFFLMAYNIIVFYFRLPYFHVSDSALFFAWYFGTLILYRRGLETFYWNCQSDMDAKCRLLWTWSMVFL